MNKGWMNLGFVPANLDLGLLVLRLWLGLQLLLLHGLSKLTGFAEMSQKFPDPLGVSSSASLGLAVFAEVVCSLLVAMGLFTRLAALVLCIHFSVAFFLVHHAALNMGPGSGELAFVYLAGFVTLLITGAGRYSLDHKLGARSLEQGRGQDRATAKA